MVPAPSIVPKDRAAVYLVKKHIPELGALPGQYLVFTPPDQWSLQWPIEKPDPDVLTDRAVLKPLIHRPIRQTG